MERFGRIIGRLISIAGLLFTAFVATHIYRTLSTPPCQIDLNRRSPSYVCEDFRKNSGIEINGINQLFNPYTDSEIIAKSNDDPKNVKSVVQTLIHQGILKERIDWNVFRGDLLILGFGLLIFIAGSFIGKSTSRALKHLFS